MSDKIEWVALYEASNGTLTTRLSEKREFWNNENKSADSEVMPTRYVGQVKMKIIAPVATTPKPKNIRIKE